MTDKELHDFVEIRSKGIFNPSFNLVQRAMNAQRVDRAQELMSVYVDSLKLVQVAQVYKKVGDTVTEGEIIASIHASEDTASILGSEDSEGKIICLQIVAERPGVITKMLIREGEHHNVKHPFYRLENNKQQQPKRW